ncbi:MAG: RluA family pseudouridine synthase [Planctomycetota bacterium JB042]
MNAGGTLNEGCEHRAPVPGRNDGLTALAHLRDRFPRADEATWRRRLAAGEVRIAGVPVPAERVVRAGEVVVWRRPPWREPDVPLGFAVLYRDADVLAVAKPSGLPTLPGGGRFYLHTLGRQVRRAAPDARPAHRLGRHTTGVVLCGRSVRGRRALADAFRDGTVEKEYLALVEGAPPAGPTSVDVPLGPVPHPKLGTVTAASPTGKPSRSEVVRLERRGEHALCLVRIATGRAHQIRIHCAALGHPLVGDPLYGPGGLPKSDAVPGDGGYLLHAARIVFPHPADGRPVEVTCPPPPPLRPRPASR